MSNILDYCPECANPLVDGGCYFCGYGTDIEESAYDPVLFQEA